MKESKANTTNCVQLDRTESKKPEKTVPNWIGQTN